MVPPLLGIIEEATRSASINQDPAERAVGTHYDACMKAETDLRARGSLSDLVRRVDGIVDLPSLARVAAQMRQRGSGAFFGFAVDFDPGDSGRYIVTIDQGGMELPSRSNYLDPAAEPIRQRYRQHIARLGQLLGTPADAEAVLRIETALAQASLPPSARKDVRSLYHLVSWEELVALAPSFPWAVHFEEMGVPLGTVNVRVPAFLQALEGLLTSASLSDLRHYLRWQLLQDNAAFLDQPVLDELRAFWGPTFWGVSGTPPARWWTCFSSTINTLGMAVSALYVRRHVEPGTAVQPAAILASVRAALRVRIGTSVWLDEPTRGEALAKLEAMGQKVGHPETWEIPVTEVALESSWLDQHLARSQAAFRGGIQWLLRPTDRTLWTVPPITVNAFYSRSLNEAIVPLGTLQAPWFTHRGSTAVNLGAIGVLMGHELTHAFDDSGRHFDQRGNLRDWWSPVASAAFEQRAQCVVGAFTGQQVLGQQIDAQLTLDENLADLGGLRLALEALTAAGQGPPSRDEVQAFFLGYAQTRCSVIQPQALVTAIATDPHAPDKLRVNVPLAHMPEFAEAFGCSDPSPMRARALCSGVW